MPQPRLPRDFFRPAIDGGVPVRGTSIEPFEQIVREHAVHDGFIGAYGVVAESDFGGVGGGGDGSEGEALDVCAAGAEEGVYI